MNKVINRGGTLIQEYEYGPGIEGATFAAQVSNLMHQIVKTVGKFTLAEMGYLHINTLTYDQTTRSLHLRVYFDARLAARVRTARTSKTREICPIDELNVFKNFMFVGDLTDVVTYEKIVAPKYKIIEQDELGRPAIQFKDTTKFEETNALVLNCNLALTAAASHNFALLDPEFNVACKTIGKSSKSAEKSIITTAGMKEIPVIITIVGSAETGDEEESGYDPADAIPYLQMVRERAAIAAHNQGKLEKKVRDKAKAASKKQQKKANAGFNKYS